MTDRTEGMFTIASMVCLIQGPGFEAGIDDGFAKTSLDFTVDAVIELGRDKEVVGSVIQITPAGHDGIRVNHNQRQMRHLFGLRVQPFFFPLDFRTGRTLQDANVGNGPQHVLRCSLQRHLLQIA